MTDAVVESQIATLAQLPSHVAGRFPATSVRRCTPDGYDEMSGREFFEQIRDVSLGLAALGVCPGDRVALICETRPEWLLSDLGTLCAGAVAVPIYPTLPPSLVGFILKDAGVETVIASDEEQADKVRQVKGEVPQLRNIVVVEPGGAPRPTTVRAEPDNSGDPNPSACLEVSLAQVAQRGHQRLMHENGLAREFEEAVAAVASDQLATIIYTSGTTGPPKGVMLTHGAIVANLVDADQMAPPNERDDALSFLPLCHALERMVVYLYLYKGVRVTFAESLDTVPRDMMRVKPTIMTGVPRVFDKLRARVLEAVAESSRFRQRLFQWALRVGEAKASAELDGRQSTLAVRLQHRVADRLVLSKVRERVGGRLRFVVSGGAPLSSTVAGFLFAVGIPVLEGYGLTETAPVLTVNPLAAPRIGTVGKALPRVELRVADDGEILARGPNLMLGYYKRADATAEVVRDGWFHTGDIGRLDDDGYLSITDRKKAILVTAGGKNVAPQPIEEKLKQHALVSEAMLLGDARPFVAAVIVPDFASLGARMGVTDADRASLVGRDDVRTLFETVVNAVNTDLPAYAQLKKFALVATELTQAGGELTPTMKVKRQVVAERWKDTIDALYTRP
jgi:long-chain acyl-CoA synthetase